ncbi:MAG: hypothetical protein RL603_654 [Pseudomonadota bacterium]|jgi:outer membrane protein assembly factor BamA
MKPHARLPGVAWAAWLVVIGAMMAPIESAARQWLPKVGARSVRLAPTRPAEVPSDAALVAAGAVIGEIRIHARPIFDTTQPEEDAELFRLANKLHIRTRDDTIATQLLFAPGDRYDPRVLAETARILRTTRYLQEAYVTPVAFKDGKVDIEVVSYDVWTLNPGASFGRRGGRNTSGFEIEELNLLGTGTALSASRRTDLDRTSTTFLYNDRQIGDSWWSIAAQYSDNSDGRTEGLTLDRDFFSLDSRWAAGLNVLNDERVTPRYDVGRQTGAYRSRSRYATLYGGWSAGLARGEVLRWRAGYTFDDRRFDAAPGSTFKTTPPPNRKLAYPWASFEWLQDDYRVLRNRDQIERTEDSRYGWRATALLGYANRSLGADRDAVLYSGSLSRGFELDAERSVLFESTLTGRNESGRFVDTVFATNLRYYQRQSERRLLYAALGAEVGHAIDADRQITLGGDNGLRGYPLRYQGGEGRWLFTLEQRAFSNWYPFRLVNVGAAAFVDVGGSFGTNRFGTRARGVLSDVGVGLRFGNNRSALGNVLHVDVAFPLNRDASIKSVQFLVETKRSF